MVNPKKHERDVNKSNSFKQPGSDYQHVFAVETQAIGADIFQTAGAFKVLPIKKPMTPMAFIFCARYFCKNSRPLNTLMLSGCI